MAFLELLVSDKLIFRDVRSLRAKPARPLFTINVAVIPLFAVFLWFLRRFLAQVALSFCLSFVNALVFFLLPSVAPNVRVNR
jgi:hypothetical protein